MSTTTNGVHVGSDDVRQAWRERAADLAGWTLDHLVNRMDACGRYLDIGARTPDKSVWTDKGELDPRSIERHFRGSSFGDVMGLHSTVHDAESGKSYCRWCAVDIDRHGDEIPAATTAAAALSWRERAEELGFHPLLLDSNGNGGYHLVLLFDTFVESGQVYALGRWLTRDWQAIGLDRQPETFPKQATIEAGRFGNWLRLPGRHHTREHWTRVWKDGGWLAGSEAIDHILGTVGASPACIPAKALEVPERKPKPAGAMNGTDADYDAREAARALDFLDPDMSYPEWLAIGMALSQLGRTGLDLWDRWSGAGSKYKEGEPDRKFRTFVRQGEKVNLGTLFKHAKDRGFEFTKGYAKQAGYTEYAPRGANGVQVAERGELDGADFNEDAEPPPPRDESKRQDFLPFTDIGNAERLVARFGRKIRYVHAWKKWLVYNRQRWEVDGLAKVQQMAKKTVRAIYAEAARVENDEDRKDLAKFARKSESRDAQSAMLTQASYEAGIPIMPADLDPDPWLLNCQNGTLDLRTARLQPHDPADMITKMVPVRYDPESLCPEWENTLRIFLDSEDTIAYLQRFAGYCLTAVIRELVLPIAWGDGANGKSTILGTLLGVMGGDYAMKTSADFLAEKKGSQHQTERMELHNKRLVVAIETGEGQRLDENFIKELTGGDIIRGRRMRENSWEFPPTHKIIMATNHRPAIKGTDNAIWRRLKLIPFNYTMTADKARLDMPALLRAEYPGILAWMVRGCLEWQRIGLGEPAIVSEATMEYRESEDTVGTFVRECCVIHPLAKVKAGGLYARYQSWCKESGTLPMSHKKFGPLLLSKGESITKQVSDGTRYIGIELQSDYLPIDEN